MTAMIMNIPNIIRINRLGLKKCITASMPTKVIIACQAQILSISIHEANTHPLKSSLLNFILKDIAMLFYL
jgi:hypothetical protein